MGISEKESVWDAWARELSAVFTRVALFERRHLSLRVAAVSGIDTCTLDLEVSLQESTPLRWCVAAASPQIGAGEAPGGRAIADMLGMPSPRAFAVIPLVAERQLIGLAYVDQAEAPLPLELAGRVFSMCAEIAKRAGRPKPRYVARPQAVPSRPRIPPARAEFVTSIADRIATEPPDEPEPTRRRLKPPVHPPPPPPESWSDRLLRLGKQATGKPRRRARTTTGFVSLLAVVLGLAGLSMVLPTSNAGTVRVAPGASVAEIADTLREENIIRSPLAFNWLVRLTGAGRMLRAGNYSFTEAPWLWDVVQELKRGQINTVTFTVPEGKQLKEVAKLVEEAGLGPAGEFIRTAASPDLLQAYGIASASAEGYLYPETYSFAEGVAMRRVLEAMLDTFFAKLKLIPGAGDLTAEKMHDVVTLASIVQEETRSEQEMPRISGVFRNRLKRGIKLESCSTVQYVLGFTKARLTLADVRQPSPYNTYLHKGLPPGPIANPGLPAIEAAIHPEQNPYLFFFAREDGSGTHVFSQTYDEHLRRRRSQRAAAASSPTVGSG